VVSNSIQRNFCEVYRTFFMLANVHHRRVTIIAIITNCTRLGLYNRKNRTFESQEQRLQHVDFSIVCALVTFVVYCDNSVSHG